ncbi:glutamyl-tRNA(Gln) amidotransferase subunit B, mitochondrial-like [Euroglyphus maynei]|uniref:Glutamyl-tRNA(Gln) amidotransferase subunit B, mitochondrial n=1 Tax=Euroglyphus maynei TaxID=6958 RepID=A0A1Y3ARW2_EURMA|nr:glutamyl-tRNA(Gln) amidotransferase subunit B, mitochondrial-like [Euroglyphus maynei]
MQTCADPSKVHAQILSESKLFSSASTNFASRPNSQATYFDVSLPGTLPVLNRKCVVDAIKTGLALNCIISNKSTFDRKHYFYGDMPNGYQITQQRNPIARDGYIEFIVHDDFYENDQTFQPYLKRCRLKQIQLEQDSGKSLVDDELNVNLIDLNRAGVPLLEFVFEPDLHSTLEAISLVRELIAILKSIQTCSCRMEEGALRVDANVSVRLADSRELGTRTEIKNLNSFRFIREASEYEIQRQCSLLEIGEKIINETLGYDIRTKSTFVMRDKEIVQDYRFMPEPNLPPIILADDDEGNKELINIDAIRKEMPRLPEHIRANLLDRKFNLSLREIYFLIQSPTILSLFYQIFESSQRKCGLDCFNFIVGYLKPIFQDKIDPFTLNKIESIDSRFSMETILEFVCQEYLTELCDMIFDEKISETTAYDILKLYLQNEQRSPSEIVEKYNWWLIRDIDQIEQVCRQVIQQVPKIAKKYAKNGVRKQKSMLIQKAFVLMNNQVNEKMLWDTNDNRTQSCRAGDEKIKQLEKRVTEMESKPAAVAKSSVVLDVKPWDDETDMKEVERLVRTIQMDGLVWAKLAPLAYGIKKLQIVCVIEDEKVSVEELSEKIGEFEDHVQSVDVAAFNKI